MWRIRRNAVTLSQSRVADDELLMRRNRNLRNRGVNGNCAPFALLQVEKNEVDRQFSRFIELNFRLLTEIN